MKKNIGLILLALLIGILLFKVFTSSYDLQVSSNSELVYFVQYGVYSSYDSMKDNTKSLEKFIYNVDKDKYYVYLGFTKDKNNLEKIKGYFSALGYSIYSKEIYINNVELLNIIPTYDALITNVTDNASIKYILTEELEKYVEVMNEDS